MNESKFEEWCIVELMGHRRLAGFVREQVLAGAAFVRIDVPSEPPATQLYGPSAIYCITPTTEELARAVAKGNAPTPVQRWELPALPSRAETTPAPAHDEDLDGSDEFDEDPRG